MSENLCMSCTAACCKGPIIMELSPEEQAMMREAGTVLQTIADPVDYDRDDVPYPIGSEIDTKKKTIRHLYEKGRETEPLAADLGRYVMLGSCGNLREILGREQCGIYDNRPQVCRDFEMAGDKCLLIRRRNGVDSATS